MDILISNEIEVNEQVDYLRRMTERALQQNRVWLSSDGFRLELIAVIVPGASADEYSVDFALCDAEDGRIRTMVISALGGDPIPIDELLQSSEPFIDPTLCLRIATMASEAKERMEQESSSQALH